MKPSLSALSALAAIALHFGAPVLADTPSNVQLPNASTPATPKSASSSSANDEANSSPRERGRVLVKRNPIASEYQIFGDNGASPGADADGEGVDYRAFLPTQNPTDIKNNQLTVGYNLNYNAFADATKHGGDVSFAYRLGTDSRWAMTGLFRSSASDRHIEHYESLWQTPDFEIIGHPGDAYLLDRPRYSFDRIYTRNNLYNLSLGFQLAPNHALFFKTSYQDYFDNAYRNRLEYQFGGSQIDQSSIVFSGDNISSARFTNARTRRYFGDTDNYRERLHTLLGGSYKGDTWSIDYSVYSQKWDLDTLWHDWNFNDFNLDLTYRIEDRYLPTISSNNGGDILDTSAARFTSFRIHDTYTRDRDQAGRIDAERRLHIADLPLWLQTGMLARKKERETGQSRDVYSVNSANPFYLSDVDLGRAPTDIVNNRYTLQDGLDPAAGLALLQSDPSKFKYDAYKSHTEAQPQGYAAEESVIAAYALLVADMDPWSITFGLRGERTSTDTRGRVYIPALVDNPDQGVLIETLVNPDDGKTYLIKDLYSENSYTNILPTIEVTYEINDTTRIRASAFELLMRPQYFNIIAYRRVNIPTRTVSEGNPYLEPTSIRKARVAWIKDLENKGSLSIEAYGIDIENFFYGAVSDETILENGVPEAYRVSRIENGDGGRIHGLELQWKQPLPSAFGIEKANLTVAYTYSDSDATLPTRPNDRITVPERSRHLLKTTLQANIGKLAATIDLAYQSEALDGVGNEYAKDEYREPVITTELGLRYPISKTLSLYANFFNLADHPERSYENDPFRVTQNQYSSWFSVLGFRQQL